MDLSEFKAWVEDFTEEMTKTPTIKQWGKIRAKIDKIDGHSTPWPIFVDRYARPYPYWWGGTLWTTGIGGIQTITIGNVSNNVGGGSDQLTVTSNADAWQHAGRCGALSITTGDGGSALST